MKKKELPLIITPKDVERITGWTYRTVRRKMTLIRKRYNKSPRSPVLLREFCQAMHFSEQDLLPFF